MTVQHRHAKREAQGSQQARRERGERPVAFEPPPHEVALLRGIWGQRHQLSASTRGLVAVYLERVQRRPLTAAELAAAVAIGQRLGIGFDAPEEPGDRARRPAPQPWGPLPLRPPGRSA